MIYEDGAVVARIPEEPAADGHVELALRQDAQTLADVPREQAVQLFFAASFAATALFETLGAAGTNIVVQEGAGVRVDVYSRSQEDNLGLLWQASQADQQQLQSVAKKVTDAFWYVGKDTEDDASEPQVSAPEPEESTPKTTEDYRVKQLRRSP